MLRDVCILQTALCCSSGEKQLNSLLATKANALLAGALPLLLAMLRKPDFLQSYQYAAGAVRHMTHGTQQNKDAVVAAGALPALVEMLYEHEDTAAEAAWALCNITDGHEKYKAAVLQAGMVNAHNCTDSK